MLPCLANDATVARCIFCSTFCNLVQFSLGDGENQMRLCVV